MLKAAELEWSGPASGGRPAISESSTAAHRPCVAQGSRQRARGGLVHIHGGALIVWDDYGSEGYRAAAVSGLLERLVECVVLLGGTGGQRQGEPSQTDNLRRYVVATRSGKG